METPTADDREAPAEPPEIVARALVRPILLYDGGCRFCRWAARVVARLDRDEALAFLSVRGEEAEPIMAAIPEQERFASWHIVLPDGTRLSRGPGWVVLLEQIWWTRSLGRLCRVLRFAPLLGAVDALIAKKKGRLSRKVPDGPGPHRFP